MLVGVLLSLTMCVKCWSVILSLLDCVPCVGLCSCVSNTVCQVLVCVIVFLHCMSCVGLCSCVSYIVYQVYICVLVSLTLCVGCWSVFLCL